MSKTQIKWLVRACNNYVPPNNILRRHQYFLHSVVLLHFIQKKREDIVKRPSINISAGYNLRSL